MIDATATGNPTLDAALAYAHRGWPVIPIHAIDGGRCTCGDADCKSPGKHPRTAHGLNEATTGEAAIRRWWGRWADANVAMVTGARSVIFVVDVDPRHGGDDSLSDLEHQHGELPNTVESITGGGGRHIFFAHPGGGARIPNSSGKLGPGLDVRGDGGYVVVEPSLHASGRRYAFELSHHPSDTKPAAAPAWLLEMVIEEDEPAAVAAATVQVDDQDRVRLCVDAMLRMETKDQADGSKRLFAYACRAVEHGLADDQAVRIVRAAEVLLPFPKGYTDQEVVRRVRDAEKKVKRGAAIGRTGRLVHRCLADVEPEEVSWLWHRRLPLGKLSVLAGVQGIGKSFMTLDMAARVSTGTAWPDAREEPIPPGDVVILSAEDAPADTIRPRLDAARAAVRRIHIVEGVRDAGGDEPRSFNLQRDLYLLGRYVEELGAVRLAVIDPLNAYLGEKIDAHKDADVRRVLHPLSVFAANHNVAVVTVAHLNKTPGDQAIYRVLGSVAFTAAARAAWLVAPDKADRDRRLLLPLKMNLARAAPGLAFKIEDAQVMWIEGAVDVTADEALAADQPGDDGERAERQQAREWLEDLLADGPKAAGDIDRWAKQNGFAKRTLARAKAAANVKSTPVYEGGRIASWTWQLRQKAKVATLPLHGTLGNVGNVGNVISKGAKGAKGAKVKEGGDVAGA